MRIAMLLLASLLGGCSIGERCENMGFERFGSTDRVVVNINSQPVGDPITDSNKIHALITFVQAHTDGWSVYVTGPPVARVRGEYFHGGKFLGDFGVGETFASAQGCDYFQTRRLSRAETREYAQLLGVKENEISWK